MDRYGWEQRVGRAAATMSRVTRGGGAGAGGDGFMVPILSKTDYSFDGRASGSTQAITLAAGIDTVPWVSGVLIVRLHAKNTWSATATLSVLVENVSLVPEDPSVLFANTASPLATVNLTNGAVAPGLTVQALSTGIAAMVQVRLTWAQGATAAGAAQTCSLSVDLLGRPA